MINLIVMVIGVLMVLLGFYLMYLGFSIPPNPLSFFLGLIISVLGLILVILYSSKIGSGGRRSSPPPRQVQLPKKYSQPRAIEPEKIQSKGAKKAEKRRPLPKPVKPKPKKEIAPAPPREVKKETPKAKSDVAIEPQPRPMEKPPMVKPEAKDSQPEPELVPVKKAPEPEKLEKVRNYGVEKKPLGAIQSQEITATKPKPDIMVQKESELSEPILEKSPPAKIKPEKVKKEPEKEKDKKDVSTPKKDKKPIKPVFKRPSDEGQTGDKYVKDRLEKLKKEYFQDTKYIENIIDERLDSFKGTINRMKTESTEPSIIWSFEAKDVQGAMKNTVSNAQDKILLMYPWVRNIDVSILKKFMDTDSKMIIQEASLDDDASVELIRLLMQNQVEIRTMPHVHTVALVADDKDGLIISTDPIYESYEVGVIYKDQKSIQEIEKMFEEAWNISKEINMEYKE